MISIDEVLQIHEILIEGFGSSNGVSDNNLLQSAIARPFKTFEHNDLYPTTIDKPAALIESVINNHPFVDGNKRAGLLLMMLLSTLLHRTNIHFELPY